MSDTVINSGSTVPSARVYQRDFLPRELKARRGKVIEAIGASAIAIVQGAPKNSTHDLFRQSNDFYYLTGVEVPHAYLLMDGKSGKSSLFLPHRSRELAEREGELLSSDNAQACRELVGVDEVIGPELLAQRLEGVTCLYTPFRQGEGLVSSWDTLQRARQDAMSDPWDGQPGPHQPFPLAPPGALPQGRDPRSCACAGCASPREEPE